MPRNALIRCFVALLLAFSGMLPAAGSEPFGATLARGIAAREAGNLTLAIDTLRQAEAAASPPGERQQGAAALLHSRAHTTTAGARKAPLQALPSATLEQIYADIGLGNASGRRRAYRAEIPVLRLQSQEAR